MKQSLNYPPSGPSKIQPVIHKEVGSSAWGILSGTDVPHVSSDASLFSSSLPVLRHEKLNLNDAEHGGQSVDDLSSGLNKLHQDVEGNDSNESFEDGKSQAVGTLLPDDEDELLAGIMDNFDLTGLLEDSEECDLFGSGGGLELENDPQESLTVGMSNFSLSDAVVGNGMPTNGLPNGVGTVAGEHPYGEHPSRTLFVRNINSNVEDSELRDL